MTTRLAMLASLALLTAALAGCGSSGNGSTTSAGATTAASTTTAQAAAPIPVLRFSYPTAAPLRYVDGGRVNRRSYPIAIHDVSFVSDGKRVKGFLLIPPGSGRRPAVVFVHGAGGDRGSLLVQAAWLAARNVVTLAITEPSSGYPPPVSSSLARRLRQVRDVQVEDVVAERRAVDVLQTLPEVDPKRIGYVGLSAGAKTGVLVAASEPRLKALALLSAGGAPISDFVARAPAHLKSDTRRILGSIDPIRYAARVRPGTVLLENGYKDEIVPRQGLVNIVEAAPKGTVVRWYDAGHELNEGAYHDAYDWLATKLGATGPRVPGAAVESAGASGTS
jgi:dienelactone hydrolase